MYHTVSIEYTHVHHVPILSYKMSPETPFRSGTGCENSSLNICHWKSYFNIIPWNNHSLPSFDLFLGGALCLYSFIHVARLLEMDFFGKPLYPLALYSKYNIGLQPSVVELWATGNGK